LLKRPNGIAFTALALAICVSQSGPAARLLPADSVSQSADSSHSEEPNTVTIDLIALGKDGQPISDLKPEDLHVFEDRQELKIKSLSPAMEEPLTLGILFDASGSRREDRFISEEARLASDLAHSVWREGDTGFVLLFSSEVYFAAKPTGILEEIDEGLDLVPQATYHGPTALYDALTIADPAKFAAAPGRKSYVVFSDFEDNTSRHKPEQVLEAAHRAGVAIFPVLLRDGFGAVENKRSANISKEQAQMIADKTGGEVLIPESGKQLAAIMQTLSSHLKSAYRIAYIPSASVPRKAHNGTHIHLETTREHVKLLYPKA
jgi:VWFA-related protein